MTSNCLIEPQPTYRDRIFTLGPVAGRACAHLDGHDFGAVIAAGARRWRASPATRPSGASPWASAATRCSASPDKVIDAVKSGALRHFFLIGGCDGAKPGRNYYTEFAERGRRRMPWC